MIFSETNESLKLVVFLTFCAAISSIGLIYIINTAAEHAANPEIAVSLYYLTLFIIIFVIYFISKRVAFIKSMAIVEHIVKNLRIRISDKVRYASLESIDKIGLSIIQARLSADTVTVSNSSYVVISAVQSVLILIFGMFYVFYLSPVSFFIALVAIVSGALVYVFYNDITVKQIDKAINKDDEFFQSLLNIIEGFNELKINQLKSDDIIKYHSIIAEETEDVRNETSGIFANSSILVQLFVYLLLGSIVFLLPQLSDVYSDTAIKVVAILIFIMGPIETITAAIPNFSRANRSALFLNKLEEEIDKLADYSRYDTQYDIKEFDKITLDNVHFNYKDHDGKPLFGIGPFSMYIQQGELLFIRGGNGSGKTTFMKILTLLYQADGGMIKVDKTLIHKHNVKNYQNLYSMILTDFHLFDRFYGVEDLDLDRLNELLEKMQISHKVQFKDNKFSNINLSTGQRKRLALIMALMEDKQIYILDEWAVDQDPVFREHFYLNILPDLKKQGKTIIAVTHDDHYFHVADRVLKMNEGNFEDVN